MSLYRINVCLTNFSGMTVSIDGDSVVAVAMQADTVPPAVPLFRQEVAQQLHQMQEVGVINPSNSPWASPIVLVRKKDGVLHICIDYCPVNAVTKADQFPIPRIADLLVQLEVPDSSSP